MKKTMISLAAVIAAFTFFSCEKEPAAQEDIAAGESSMVIHASTESNLTKTSLSGNDTDGYDVLWRGEDEIVINGNICHINSGIGTTEATFTINGYLANGEYDAFYKAYPIIQVKQTYKEGEIPSSPMHAKVKFSGGEPEPAQFHNLCGLLRLKIKGDSNVKVSKIKVSADQQMFGSFDIVNYAAVMKNGSDNNYTWLDCGDGVSLTSSGVDFFISLPAGEYSNVVIEVTNVTTLKDKKYESVCTKKLKSGNTLNIERSKITPASFTVSDFIPSKLEAVDLGLSVLWANMNVGALAHNQSGDYFAWGETSTKSPSLFIEDYYFDNTYTKYNASGETALAPEDDAAHERWGGDWRMPTDKEFLELFDATKTEWRWVSANGETINGETCYNGMLITSKTTGNSIYLGSTGYYNGSTHSFADNNGSYWAGTVSTQFEKCAYCLRISYPYNATDGYHERHSVYDSSVRYYGMSIRPVCSKPVAN